VLWPCNQAVLWRVLVGAVYSHSGFLLKLLVAHANCCYLPHSRVFSQYYGDKNVRDSVCHFRWQSRFVLGGPREFWDTVWELIGNEEEDYHVEFFGQLQVYILESVKVLKRNAALVIPIRLYLSKKI
jgi:hypothetical protein